MNRTSADAVIIQAVFAASSLGSAASASGAYSSGNATSDVLKRCAIMSGSPSGSVLCVAALVPRATVGQTAGGDAPRGCIGAPIYSAERENTKPAHAAPPRAARGSAAGREDLAGVETERAGRAVGVVVPERRRDGAERDLPPRDRAFRKELHLEALRARPEVEVDEPRAV